MTSNKRIPIAAILGAHGVQGEVKLISFAEDLSTLTKFGPLYSEDNKRAFRLTLRGKGENPIARIEGIADRDAAQALKGQELFIPLEALPAPKQGTYYFAELVGLAVVLPGEAKEKAWGEVIAMHNYGAGDILEIAVPGKANELVPFQKDWVGAVDKKAGTIEVTPPDILEAKGDGA